jgi:hypothetical protein
MCTRGIGGKCIAVFILFETIAPGLHLEVRHKTDSLISTKNIAAVFFVC